MTPMLRHYLEVKSQHSDALLLYRMGDFFEMFFEDAQIAAPILEVTLTARNKGGVNETPMCGVPHHAIGVYLGKLLKSGYKVAICDQVEDPKEAKGLVKREVTRVVTPGTVNDPSLLEGKEENLLAAVSWNGEAGGGAFLEVSTGRFFASRWDSPEQAIEELAVHRPREVVIGSAEIPAAVAAWVESEAMSSTHLDEGARYSPKRAHELLTRQLETSTLRGFGLRREEPAVVAAATALAYARDNQQSELSHVDGLSVREPNESVVLDATTVANLEVFKNQRSGGRRGTLISVVDKTVTSGGGRLLRGWLQAPLRDPDRIGRRHQAVGELLEDIPTRERVRSTLGAMGDLERLLSRAVLGALSPREAATLRDTLRRVPELLQHLTRLTSPLFGELRSVDVMAELAVDLERTLMPDPAPQLKNGGVIGPGLDADLDRYRDLTTDSKKHLLSIEKEEREKTGISSLKIRYNKVFGYYLEVTKANQALVPEHYIRKQTLVNSERYITPELKELEEQILQAEERQLALEAKFFEALLGRIVAAASGLTELARAIARVDVLAAFAELAEKNRYGRAVVVDAGEPIEIEDGRHPVVETLGGEAFVPNDVLLDDESQIVLLTGPNMGGKSTYLRQVALIVLLAQAGSYVPAKSARIGAVDRIFTRVGASDDLSRGDSTFMVEMIETAKILHSASQQSLVILDEVGRGTATFDGLSLAWAVVEYLHEHGRPKTLFATHYHELTELSSLLARVTNRTMAVKEWQDKIVFLRRVIEGSADKSYGLHVARLAGIPTKVIDRAGEILSNLEAQEYDFLGKPKIARGNSPTPEGPDQMRLFTPADEIVAGVLRELDVDRLSPMAALNLLHTLVTRLRE